MVDTQRSVRLPSFKTRLALAPPENERMDLNFLVYKLEFLKLLKSTKNFQLSEWISLRKGQPDIELQFPSDFSSAQTPFTVTPDNFYNFLQYIQDKSISTIAWQNIGTAKFAE